MAEKDKNPARIMPVVLLMGESSRRCLVSSIKKETQERARGLNERAKEAQIRVGNWMLEHGLCRRI